MHLIRRLLGIRLSQPTVAGLWYGFLWMMIGALILSLLLQGDMLEEVEMTVYTYLVHAVAVLFGGIVSGKRAKQKGWYQGALTGALYVLLLLLISFLAMDTSLGLQEWGLILPGFVIGAIGGMIGVNLGRK
ncbi:MULTISPECIES: TIGR04086 family membrane protein [Paenibacillus]|jgi:putative membrane protein (TIGR04086 family)|uniref:TIGR04086 family membrane protein n=1 Tax=Paenibacillus TaxID=44249 RepID=UPI00073F16BA|nr:MULTISPECIES: TIGR04086 family membrane protein [Paenibacillus]MDU4697618.1 TIGR04086 family membrane protein [Paenibacillus sp.]